MNDERDSQLSAMFDGELPESECELLARRLGRDPALRAQWERYALIGAVVRAEPGVRLQLHVARRVSAALAAEPAYAEPEEPARPAARKTPSRSWVRPAAGAAIAAGIAAVSIFVLRAQSPVEQAPVLAQSDPAAASPGASSAPVASGSRASLPESEVIATGEAESYIVPPARERAGIAGPPAALASYFVLHSRTATPMTRPWTSSRLVIDPPSEADGAMTDASGQEAADAR
jgi:sigma-E factor negative regulatory protein RseA